MASEPAPLPPGETVPSGTTSGVLLALGSLLTVAFMALHPTVHAHEPADFVTQVGRGAAFNGLLHGSLIALVWVLFLGYTGLSLRLGMNSTWVRAGLVAYGVGGMVLTAAALTNSFVLAEFVGHYQDRPPESLEMMRHILAVLHAVNQVCSRAGILALSAAFVFWSLALLRPGRSPVVGALGLVAGGLPTLGILSGHLRMDVHGVLAFAVCQTAWSLAVAAQLLRRRV